MSKSSSKGAPASARREKRRSQFGAVDVNIERKKIESNEDERKQTMDFHGCHKQFQQEINKFSNDRNTIIIIFRMCLC